MLEKVFGVVNFDMGFVMVEYVVLVFVDLVFYEGIVFVDLMVK